MLKPPRVLVNTPYVGLFPCVWAPIYLCAMYLFVVSGVEFENASAWACVVGAPFQLAYLVGLVAGLSGGPIRLCFQGLGPYWLAIVVVEMLGVTLFVTACAGAWLGYVAFGAVGGAILVTVGLFFYTGIVVVLFRRLAEIRRGRNRLCPNCGYDRKSDLWRTPCPECGYMEQPDEGTLVMRLSALHERPGCRQQEFEPHDEMISS